MDDFYALRPIAAPGTAVFGYQPGYPVAASVVEAWELEVGIDVMPGNTNAVPYPGEDSDDRAQWNAWAMAQGGDAQTVQAASLADLKADYPEPEPDEDGNPPAAERLARPTDRPEDSALKAEWIAYVTHMGANVEWANDKSTTKADLMAWDPGQAANPGAVGDTVAAAASEAQAQE